MKNQIHLLEIGRGIDVKEAISSFISAKGWDFAYISGAVGSVTNVRLTNPTSNKIPIEVEITELDGPCEVLNFTGEIMKKEYMKEELKAIYKEDTSNLFVHIHIACSTAGASVYGGGLQQAKTFRALNVFLQELHVDK